MKLLILISCFAVSTFGINVSNKQGVSFDAKLVDIVKAGNGQLSAKVVRTTDRKEFSIPLSMLSERTLIEIIQELSQKEDPPVAMQINPQVAIQRQVNVNKRWSDYDGHKIVDFRKDPDRWKNKTVTVVGHFDFKSSYSKSFSIEQDDQEIDIIYSGLPKRVIEEILEKENFSEDLIRVSGRIEKEPFSENSFDIIAKKIEFL